MIVENFSFECAMPFLPNTIHR